MGTEKLEPGSEGDTDVPSPEPAPPPIEPPTREPPPVKEPGRPKPKRAWRLRRPELNFARKIIGHNVSAIMVRSDCGPHC
jgi:hypothetical protein